MPLATWLLVAWHLVQTKIVVSALSVQRITGVNYATAWLLLQKMRAAMDQGERDKLGGDIEFDETYVGGVDPGAGGRSRGKKSPVAVACEVVSPTAMGRIRLARLPDASALAIADFLERNVEPGSVLISDDWPSYGPALGELEARGLHYEAKTTTLSKTEAKASTLTCTGWPPCSNAGCSGRTRGRSQTSISTRISTSSSSATTADTLAIEGCSSGGSSAA